MPEDIDTSLTDPLNLMTDNRWIAVIPTRFTASDPRQQKEICLNLQEFTLPGFGISTAEISTRGYKVNVPTNAMEISKELTFSYILDSALTQYKWLYAWFLQTTLSQCQTEKPVLHEVVVPIQVKLISEYKNVVLELVFENCFLKNIADLRLNYTGNNDPLKHSFTIMFSEMRIVDPHKS
jgi:hypothetical protein